MPDGRALAFVDIGEPGWPSVFFFHGAPSSRLRILYLEHRFLAGRIRLVSADRPGYGGSAPQSARSMADWPNDVAALADALAIDRFVVAGHSSGGPYALACAALLPHRVVAATTFGGVTDMAWPGAWEGYLDFESELMRLGDEHAVMERCVEVFGPDGAGFMSASGLELPEPDARLYDDERVADLLIAARAEAWRQGVTGYAQDVFVQSRPWPFDPNTIAAPVHVLHGDADTLLPMAHSHHNVDVIPGSSLRVVPGHGHFSILAELPAMASALTRTTG